MELDKELLNIASEIKEIISKKQEELSLTFIEDTHTYYMKDLNGEIRSDFPSISTVLHCFYKEFDATTTKAFKNCEGNKEKEAALLQEWADAGTYASHMGSRVHYLLEKHFIDLYGSYKEVRQPIFDCDEEQTKNGDGMIAAGKKFIDLMHERGAVLLDTEIVLGSPELGIVGQPDKMLLMRNKSGEIGLVVTDWKGLPLDTPILTNNGWKTMGTLTREDKVFDKDGNLVNIKNISTVKNKKCLKIAFDNKEEIVSDFEHRWLISSIKDGEKIMTTQEIKDYYNESETNEKLNVYITKPLNITQTINCNLDTDYDKRLSYLKNEILKYSSVIHGDQILTLNDNHNETISLISSLGIKIYFIDKNTIRFNLDNQKDNYKTIISVEEVESVPTKCIEVDSQSSTFLYGYTLSVTHNTNKKKNLVTQPWTKKMLEPFTFLEDTALSHYKLQLNFYAKILLNMLKGSKYEDLPLLGCIIVHLESDGEFTEYRVPKNITDIIMDMDMSQYLPKLKSH